MRTTLSAKTGRQAAVAAAVAALTVASAVQFAGLADHEAAAAQVSAGASYSRVVAGTYLAPVAADPTDEHGDEHVADGHAHNHDDAATKNAITREASLSADTQDPTTPTQARAHTAYAATARAATAPTLIHVPVRDPRRAVPQNRYVMAQGCYTLAGRPIFFQATDLGRYLLYTRDRKFVAPTGLAATPSDATVWTVTGKGGSFQFRNSAGYLTTSAGGFTTSPTARNLTLRLTKGCTAYPEIQVNVSGGPTAGISRFQEVRGYVDPHVHGMSHEFLGGRVICSPPWHRFGAPHALIDCDDHQAADGRGALLEDFLAGHTPGTGHDPVGWPTFGYWPNPHSLTHQGVYYKWLERSWRGGLRIFTNLLVENNVLCELYPLKKNSCDDRDAMRLQARDMRAMERYIDAQYGGPGKGWYRIVTNPFQARTVINQGKLAVIMGIETSVTLGCNIQLGQATCSEEQMIAELTAMRKLGVSQMELTNKFDNAFTGVAGDSGAIGNLTNFGNFANTGSWLRMETCPTSYPAEVHDKLQSPNAGDAPGELPEQDAIFGAMLELFGTTVQPAPLYPAGPHCNQMGLTAMGKSLLRQMTKRHILFDPDHMSVYGRKAALTYLEQLQRAGQHPGVISSHSWSTPDAYPRIYKLGGFIAPYAGDSTGFVEKWRQHLKWVDPRFYFGFGYGADMNGFGSQGDARGAGVPNPVTYPFTGLGGVVIGQQHSARRVYDINKDGVSHYGLYPDWLQDAKTLAGADGTAFMTDMARGAEAYLQTWERTFGIAPDPCRNPGLRKNAGTFTSLITRGLTTRQVMARVGQPFTRLGTTFGYCARTASDPKVSMKVTFSAGGRVTGVRRLG